MIFISSALLITLGIKLYKKLTCSSDPPAEPQNSSEGEALTDEERGNGIDGSSHRVSLENSKLEQKSDGGGDVDSARSKKKAEETRRFTPFVATAFSINYAIGTGFLTIPYAFVRGGIVLSAITLAVVVFISNITKNYVLECMALAESVTEDLERKRRYNNVVPLSSLDLLSSANETCVYGSVSTLQNPSERASLGLDGPARSTSSSSSSSIAVVKSRKFELTELCRIFLGDLGQKLFIACLALLIYGQLWGFTSVFSSALARGAPIRRDYSEDYRCYTIVFAVLVIPLSCLELTEQIHFQIALTICRVLVIITMIVTTVIAAVEPEADEEERLIHFQDVDVIQGAPMFRFEGFHQMFPVVAYSVMFHQNIPGLSKPVVDKRELHHIFRNVFIICGVAFCLLGVVVAWYFGDQIEQSANLNWHTYIGGAKRIHPGSRINVNVWAHLIAAFVLSFPALNCLSAFPLNVVTLGNNLMGFVYGSSVHDFERSRSRRIIFRLISSIPPVIGALFVRELGTINSYAGVTGFAVMFSFPALLYIASKRVAYAKGLSCKTHYEGFCSTDRWAFALYLFSIVTALYVTISLLIR